MKGTVLLTRLFDWFSHSDRADSAMEAFDVPTSRKGVHGKSLADFIEASDPHYFVITVAPADIQDLVSFLDGRYTLVKSDTDLRIYDLTRPLIPGIPAATVNPMLTSP